MQPGHHVVSLSLGTVAEPSAVVVVEPRTKVLEPMAKTAGAIRKTVLTDISQLTFKSMAIVSTLHRHGNSIPFAALR